MFYIKNICNYKLITILYKYIYIYLMFYIKNIHNIISAAYYISKDKVF